MVAWLGVAPTTTAQSLWFVDAGNTNDLQEDGSAEHPFDTIQEGIGAATHGDSVLVEDGVYKGPGNRDIKLYGKRITLRSKNGPAACIIDCETNAVGFRLGGGESRACHISGFTVQHGYSTAGAGISLAPSSATISNCVVRDNESTINGGGIYTYNSSALIVDTVITGNRVTSENLREGLGGGFHAALSSVDVIDCRIENNTAAQGGGGAYGGQLVGCLIRSNTALWGGGVYDSAVSNCTIEANHADYGGGANWGLVVDSAIIGNFADSGGGGSASAELERCVVSENVALWGGGTYYGTVRRCVIATNDAEHGGGCNFSAVIESSVEGNRATENGGGCAGGDLYGCALTANTAHYGGGAHDATLRACTLTVNRARTNIGGGGGGVKFGALYDCVLSGNEAYWGGGADSAMLSGCTLVSNAATHGGGSSGGNLSYCALIGNTSSRDGGGSFYDTLTYCDIRDNASVGTGGGGYESEMTGCVLSNNTGSSGGGVHGGMLTACTLVRNIGRSSGGGALGATLIDCTLTANTTPGSGGGALGGTLDRCVLNENTALVGGGTASATLNNSAVYGNSATNRGGGVHASIIAHCTISGNRAPEGGGASESTAYNSIVYYNAAWLGNDLLDVDALHSCSPDLTHNLDGNITNAPGLVSVLHLADGSPCIAAGSSAWTMGSDIDGETWKTPPSMGCDEPYTDVPATGSLTVAVSGPGRVRVGYEATFFGTIQGAMYANAWDFHDGTVHTNVLSPVRHAWSVPGAYAVTLTAYSDSFPQGVTATQHLQVLSLDDATIHVSASQGADENAGLSWSTAKQTLQAGVDAQTTLGGLVIVTDGVYAVNARLTPGHALLNRMVVELPMTVQSVNGPQSTFILGEADAQTGGLGTSAVRCAYLADGVRLIGFTLTNGHTWTWAQGDPLFDQSGGGAYVETSVSLSNCILTGNTAYRSGGGILGGTLEGCSLTGNSSDSGGGAHGSRLVRCTLDRNHANYGGGCNNATLDDCLIASNSAFASGGGAAGGTLNRCVVEGNSVVFYGGGANGAVLNECLLTRNSAIGQYYSGGGGAYGGILNNCIVVENAGNYGGGTKEGTLYNCTLTANTANYGGGAYDGRLVNCIIHDNNAPMGNLGSSWWGRNLLVSFSTSPNLTHGVDGNITNRPLYVNPAAGDYRLQEGSGGIDAGTDSVGLTKDYDALPRPLDGDCDGHAAFDMGAHEFMHPEADSDGDGLRDTNEVYAIGTDPTNADTDADGSVDGNETMAGTDPLNDQSYFALEALDRAWGYPAITWRTVYGRAYRLQRSADLRSNTWENVWDFPIHEVNDFPEGFETAIDCCAPTGRPAIYRILLD